MVYYLELKNYITSSIFNWQIAVKHNVFLKIDNLSIIWMISENLYPECFAIWQFII